MLLIFDANVLIDFFTTCRKTITSTVSFRDAAKTFKFLKEINQGSKVMDSLK